MFAGKCPKCEKAVTRANLHALEVGAPMGANWKGISYNCPSCNTVLSVSIDPIAIKNDIINELFKKLRAGS